MQICSAVTEFINDFLLKTYRRTHIIESMLLVPVCISEKSQAKMSKVVIISYVLLIYEFSIGYSQFLPAIQQFILACANFLPFIFNIRAAELLILILIHDFKLVSSRILKILGTACIFRAYLQNLGLLVVCTHRRNQMIALSSDYVSVYCSCMHTIATFNAIVCI